MGDGMEPGQHDTDAAEARRIEAQRKVAQRRQLQIRAERLTQVEQAREAARRLKQESDSGAHSPLGSPAEELAHLTAAVRWMAAESRATRIEVTDRLAMKQETGREFRTEGELEDAAERTREVES